MTFKAITLAAIAAAAIASPAAAVIVNGTFAAALGGVASSTFGIQAGTVISNSGAIVTSTSSDFNVVPAFTGFTLNSFTASNGSTISFSGAFGSFTGTILNLTSTAAPTANLSFDAFGTFTPAGALGAFTPGPASLTAGFTQTGTLDEGQPEPSISGSFTFSTPPTVAPPTVPEPASWAMLIAGFGLTGAAMRRRRAVVAA